MNIRALSTILSKLFSVVIFVLHRAPSVGLLHFFSVYICSRCATKQLYSQRFCPDVSIYVCLSARFTRAAKLPAEVD